MKRTLWFVIISLALLLIGWSMLASPAALPAAAQGSPTPSLELVSIWRKTMDDQNKGDVASVLKAFTDDGAHVSGSNAYTGTAALQKFFEGNASTHTQVEIVSLTGGGQNVLLGLNEVRSDTYKARGIERIVTRATITFTGNKVSRVVVMAELSDPQTATYAKLAQGNPEAVYRKMIADLNKGDIASVMAAFNDDAKITAGSAQPVVGKAAIQAYYENSLKNHSQVDLLMSTTVNTSTVQFVAHTKTDATNAVGVDRMILNASATFGGGKISSITLVPELSDPQTATYVKAVQAQPTAVPK